MLEPTRKIPPAGRTVRTIVAVPAGGRSYLTNDDCRVDYEAGVAFRLIHGPNFTCTDEPVLHSYGYTRLSILDNGQTHVQHTVELEKP